MDKAYAQLIENAIRLNPVFVVGSGLSAGAGIATMGELAEYIVDNVSVNDFTSRDKEEWEKIKYQLTAEHRGLEATLQESGDAISEKMMREIVQQTWCCISNDEQKLLLDVSGNHDPTGFVRYFKKFKNTNNEIIHIITTNYDHLIEWSASSSNWQVWDGFNEGHIGTPLSISELNERMKRISFGKHRTVSTIQHLRIYKPHGSLSWFKYPNGAIRKVVGVGNAHLPMLRKVNITPVIVTPGIGKYLETHREPYNSVLSEMKRVLDGSRALVFLGFGFNDLHIQGSFDSLLRNGSIPKIILAMKLTDSVNNMIRDREIQNFIAIQKSDNGSEIISDRISSFITNEPNHWTFKVLLNQAWGDEKSEISRSV